MPNMASKAYGAIIQRTESPRDIEYRVFSQVTAALQEAAAPDAHFTLRVEAVHRNRELWQTLAYDLAGDGNMLPDDLKSKLLSLAIWVTGESSRVTAGTTSPDALINVNKSIMVGLRPANGGAV